MKRLRRTYKVVLNDYKRIRLHQAEAAALPAGAPPLAPLTLDAHPSLGPELTEWLADNRSTEEETAKSIRNGVDELIQLEKTSIARSCALVYASLSPTNIRQLREKHWQGLVTKYPHFLGPAPIAAAAPVHGSTTATATTLLAHWHFRPFAMAQASETATDKRPPYPGALKAKTPWRIGVATASVANATAKAAGVVEEPRHPSSTPLAKATHPAVNPVTSMGQGGHASFDYGVYRDDQRGYSPFRQSASRYRSSLR
ncbi:hypothetical protein DYB25_013896 [Aphanomyces astaci]|uniref:Uncharacterized protein n=2 Tax=Aphanomyces astaci TaxID=112090 RepID=A0A397AAI7_APHAT|nr:hypothetical protein DYB25_013896 [Aphanomyces astaci]RHZ05341.1 hypothetical protein DYB26_010927 [Aphanomyces astaci]